jgi:UPF0755 protein
MLKRYLWWILSVCAIAAGALALLCLQPYQGFEREVLLEFPRGTSSAAIARKLADAGVIRHPALFHLARAMQPFAKLQAGEYQFLHPLSPFEVVGRIGRGDIHYYELSVPEGSNIFDIAISVGKLGFLKSDAFLKAARNPLPIRDIAPKAPTLEGFLFPATYRLTRSTTHEQLIRMMTDQFRKQWKIALRGSTATDVLEKVTLASLVEKESGVPGDRPLVASVYRNRLDRDMKLDCDPTTIYAAMMEGRWRGTIYRSDLDSQHPYNTYQVKGLPPGPIANPSLASLEAALRPAQTNFLYFVAKGDGSGGTNFSPDYQTHLRYVAAYRRNQGRR